MPRTRLDGPDLRFAMGPGSPAPHVRTGVVPAVIDLFVGVFRRDFGNFFPQGRFEPCDEPTREDAPARGLDFHLEPMPDGAIVGLFGRGFRLGSRDGRPFGSEELRLIGALGAVATMRYHHLFEVASASRLELYRGGSEDHYVAAFVDPAAYTPSTSRPSRIASTIQTLRTAALSTYENQRVSTGALLAGDDAPPPIDTPPDALAYGVELTGLKSVHRLCDGTRTLFLVDGAGKLAGIVDIERFAAQHAGREPLPVPCARGYQPHARATRIGGHVCLVLSPNQEIKIFADGVQTFAFAHGRWRVLDAAAKYRAWQDAVAEPLVARASFQAALNLAEQRHGALFVIVGSEATASCRLVAAHDLLTAGPCGTPPADLAPRDPVAKRALHYLARGRSLVDLDPTVLEALASLDGALVADRAGRLLAFGAILRHDAADAPASGHHAEGARTTAALAASRHGAVLKVSEDGIVSCFLHGARVWDL